MPLGLEPAASWLRVMTCQQIAIQMANRLDFLSTPLRNVPERHRSLRAVFDQSWHMLTETEQAVLMKLSVFRGGFDLEAAEQVTGASLPILAGLADKSLIRVGAAGRYNLHELLRQYASDKLLESGQTDSTVQSHVAYFLALAEQAGAHAFGREQIDWFDQVEAELDNVRTALSRPVESETGLRMAGALGWLFFERNYFSEGLRWLEQMLAANPNGSVSLRARALHSAGALADLNGNVQYGEILCRQALALSRAADDKRNIVWSLSHLAGAILGSETESIAAVDEAVAISREIGDLMALSHNLVRRSWWALDKRDYHQLRTLVAEASIYIDKVDDKILAANIDYVSRVVCWLEDRGLERARGYFERSAVLFRAGRFHAGVSKSIRQLAVIEQLTGNLPRALVRYREAIASFPPGQFNDILTHESILVGLAALADLQGQLKKGATLLAVVDGFIPNALTYPEKYFSNNFAATVRDRLGEPAFSKAWAAGKAMTRAQAIAYALADSDATAESAPGSADHEGVQPRVPSPLASTELLSFREMEVLRLLAEGLSNAEIASKLFLSTATIKVHTRSIYRKIGVNSRTQAVAQAQKMNLL